MAAKISQRRRRAEAFLKEPVDDLTAANISAIRKSGPRSVCFFNNKGGVGKTTLVANLAAMLSLKYKFRILCVDADPQCNLTQYTVPEEDFLDIYKSDNDTASIYSIVHPLSIGKGYKDKLPTLSSENFGFDLIVGDPRLALKEDLLAQDWRDARAGGTRGLRTTFVFSDLIEKARSYDLVFFDVGPSLGAINRSVLLAVDYFVVPMSIDIFSLWAIRNIGEVVTIWQRDLTHGLRIAEDPSEIRSMTTTPDRLKFLGYVTQQHKERTEAGDKRIVEAYKEIGDHVPEEVAERLGSLYDKVTLKPHLGDIRHLASLAPKSQTQHTPMIRVQAKGSFTILRKQARDVYDSLAKRFLENLAIARIERVSAEMNLAELLS